MQKSKMLFETLENVVTVWDVVSLSGELSLLVESLFKKGESGFDYVLKNEVRNDLYKLLSPVSENLRAKTLENLMSELKEIKVLELKIACDLPRDYLEEVVKWARKNIDSRVVLAINIDPAVVAGAVISYAGRYIDLSARVKLDQVLAKKYG